MEMLQCFVMCADDMKSLPFSTRCLLHVYGEWDAPA